jgi:hypothetical protein
VRWQRLLYVPLRLHSFALVASMLFTALRISL